MDRLLIVNADDFGVDRPSTDGIIEAHLQGIVSSTSAMTNCEDFEYAVKRLHQLPTLKCGVHLNFYQGYPVLKASSVDTLVNRETGRFAPEVHASGRLDPSQLKAEFRAQIEKFRASGLEPTHLDNHRPEIYLNYELFKVVLQLAHEFRLPVRMPFDVGFTKGDQSLSRISGLSWENVQRIGTQVRRDLIRDGIRSPDHFIYSFTSGPRTEESLLQIIDTLPEGLSEICVHPGIQGERQMKEMQVLKSPIVRDRLKQQGVRLVSFDLLKPFEKGRDG